MRAIIEIPEIPEEERTQTITALLNIISQLNENNRLLAEENQRLRDKIARLKGGNPRPRIKASTLEKMDAAGITSSRGERRRRRKKRIKIHKKIKLQPENIPSGSKFIGYWSDKEELHERCFLMQTASAAGSSPLGIRLKVVINNKIYSVIIKKQFMMCSNNQKEASMPKTT